MSRTRTQPLLIASLGAIGLAAGAGCQTVGEHCVVDGRVPVVAVHATSLVPAARAPALYGERPEGELPPFSVEAAPQLIQHTTGSAGQDFDPDVYAPDELLVFASTRGGEHPKLYIKPLSAAVAQPLTTGEADDIQPRFSPDGRQVVFSSNRGGSWDLWLVQRDGTGLTQLTHDYADEVAPCWSPDGRKLAYATWSCRSRQWEIWTLALGGLSAQRFVTLGMFPAWSPDGKRLALQRTAQRGSRAFSVWTVELVDAPRAVEQEVAEQAGGACLSPRWSPDGSALVYCVVPSVPRVSDVHGSPPQADLWTVDVETGLRARLATGGTPSFSPTWSGGGRVYFVSAQGGGESIWSVGTGPVSAERGAGWSAAGEATSSFVRSAASKD